MQMKLKQKKNKNYLRLKINYNIYKLSEFDYFPGSFLSSKAPFLGSGSLRSRRLEVTDEGKKGVLEGACYAG